MSEPSERSHQVSGLATGFLVDYLKAHGVDPARRVLLTSGHHATDVAARLEGQGPLTFVPKPYRPALLRALRGLLEPGDPPP